MRFATDVISLCMDCADDNDQPAFLVLDNEEVVFDPRCSALPSDLGRGTLVAMINAQLNAYEEHTRRLRGVMRRLTMGVVNPVYKNRETIMEVCEDCDIYGPLIRSEWNHIQGRMCVEEGSFFTKDTRDSFVCCACESMREHEYGIPPSDADDVSGEGLGND